MTDDERAKRGQEIHKKVHGDLMPRPSVDAEGFSGIALRNIYNDVWGREVMSIRDRRLAVLGALAATNLMNPFEIHLRSALLLGELTWEEVDELAVALSPYIGAPRTTYVLRTISQVKADPNTRLK